MARVVQALDLDLQALDRGIDIAHRAAAAGSSPSTCHGSSAWRSSSSTPRWAIVADAREAELEMRREPLGLEAVARHAEIGEHVAEVLPDEVRQHEIVVQPRAPAAQRLSRRAGPRRRRPGRAAGACWATLMRQCGGISKARSSSRPRRPAARVRREQLVDAELGAMRVAGGVDQEVAEDAVDQPGRRLRGRARSGGRRSRARAAASLRASSTARMLAGRADEQAGEQVGRATGG